MSSRQIRLARYTSYNLGDRDNWFYYFPASSQGVDSRVYGIELHYHALHAWLPKRRHRTETEYHLASLFFNMDSVVECFVYMMNALGYAADAHSFKDITDEKTMRAIAPRNVIGDGKQSPLVGYGKFFPNVQKLWLDNRPLIELIMEHHDVSKHRFAYGLVQSLLISSRSWRTGSTLLMSALLFMWVRREIL